MDMGEEGNAVHGHASPPVTCYVAAMPDVPLAASVPRFRTRPSRARACSSRSSPPRSAPARRQPLPCRFLEASLQHFRSRWPPVASDRGPEFVAARSYSSVVPSLNVRWNLLPLATGGFCPVHGASTKPSFSRCRGTGRHLIPHIRQVESHVRAGAGTSTGATRRRASRSRCRGTPPGRGASQAGGTRQSPRGKSVHLHIHQ